MCYICDVLTAVVYVHVSCFVVRGCAVWRRYINVCNCDMFTVVNVYHEHLKFRVVCINGRRYVWCSENLYFLNCDDICICVVNKQFELIEFVFDSVYDDMQYCSISLSFTDGSVCLCGVCSHVIVFGLSLRLSWYPMWMRWLL